MKYINPYFDERNVLSRPFYDKSLYTFIEKYKGFTLHDYWGEVHATKDGVVWYMCAGLEGMKRQIDNGIRYGLPDLTEVLITAAIKKAKAL